MLHPGKSQLENEMSRILTLVASAALFAMCGMGPAAAEMMQRPPDVVEEMYWGIAVDLALHPERKYQPHGSYSVADSTIEIFAKNNGIKSSDVVKNYYVKDDGKFILKETYEWTPLTAAYHFEGAVDYLEDNEMNLGQARRLHKLYAKAGG